jgi:hypothetical protein
LHHMRLVSIVLQCALLGDEVKFRSYDRKSKRIPRLNLLDLCLVVGVNSSSVAIERLTRGLSRPWNDSASSLASVSLVAAEWLMRLSPWPWRRCCQVTHIIML